GRSGNRCRCGVLCRALGSRRDGRDAKGNSRSLGQREWRRSEGDSTTRTTYGDSDSQYSDQYPEAEDASNGRIEPHNGTEVRCCFLPFGHCCSLSRAVCSPIMVRRCCVSLLDYQTILSLPWNTKLLLLGQ